MSAGRGVLAVQAAGLEFQNPVVLAAGTAAYGQELADVVDLDAVGGLVTKAVSPEPRAGAPAPRVAEFNGGMINAVGLANPGVDAVVREHLPWLAASLPHVRKVANIVGFAVEEFADVIAKLEGAVNGARAGALDGYELNVSCPNVKAGGMEFGADPGALAAVVRRARAATKRPLFVKLSPTLPDIAASAEVAVDAGADALTLVNTIPGLVIDGARLRHRRRQRHRAIARRSSGHLEGEPARSGPAPRNRRRELGGGGAPVPDRGCFAGRHGHGDAARSACARTGGARARALVSRQRCQADHRRDWYAGDGRMSGAAATRATPIVALDVNSAEEALALTRRLGDSCRFYKVGSELFTAAGPSVVRALLDEGADVFLDLKFHDIPNTVAGAVRSAAALGVRLLTVHASGGATMLRAAQEGANSTNASSGRCQLLAVTVLTSFDSDALATTWGRDAVDVEREVVRLAGEAVEAGLHGVVCSGAEAGAVREAYGDRLALLVPGIRLAGGSSHDQRRVMTPAAAQAAGARYLILGRAVTAAADPRRAMATVLAELATSV